MFMFSRVQFRELFGNSPAPREKGFESRCKTFFIKKEKKWPLSLPTHFATRFVIKKNSFHRV
jgi:hypothetical protein